MSLLWKNLSFIGSCARVAVSSQEWQKIVKSDREKIGLTFDNDGEFWFVPAADQHMSQPFYGQ